MSVNSQWMTCIFSSLFCLTSQWGASSKDPQDLQCVMLRECNKDVHPHLKSSKTGPDEVWRVDDVKINTTKLNGVLPK